MESEQKSCRRCGNCCNSGGPALHGPDLELIKSGAIPLSALITIRQGELVHNPLVEGVAPANTELIKLKGTGKQWNCCYFDQTTNSCTIYEQRPQACRELKCWEPDAVLQMVEQDVLTRLDILAEDDPLRNLIVEHERLCPCPDFEHIAQVAPEFEPQEKRALQQLVREDLRFRSRVVKEFELKLCDELFYFGRPVFQLLQPFGARVTESSLGVDVQWGKRKDR